MRRIILSLVCLYYFQPANAQDPNELLSLKVDEYFTNIHPKPDSLKYLTASFIGRRLPAGAVFIDLLESEMNEEAVFLATIINDAMEVEVVIIPVPKAKSDVNKNVSGTPENRGGIVKNKAVSQLSSLAGYNNFWGYLAPYLTNTQTIYYSSSRLLSQVNLRFFKDSDGKFLFEKYKMIRLHSGASFLGNRQHLLMPRKMDVLLVGNLRYECPDAKIKKEFTGNWTYLPGTKTEVDDIQKQMLGKHYVVRLDSCAATESKFNKTINASRFDIVHIATHGFYFKEEFKQFGVTDDSYSLERTGIVLSGANSKTATIETFNEEGLLTAIEFKNLDLSRIRFIVLSTCHSGEGDNTQNTATLGLTLSFLRQGINAMLVSNQEVPDKETSLFMKTFYSYIMNNPDVDECYHSTISELHEKHPETDWSFFDLVH